ncbi:hypothetical protein DY000_02041382 [Brassica cretica]|uniref:Uncharacterized protein n=1 Tax=Brassica cretica TaxID=69181 RepID=A0ABQ7BNI0_BRACR|nr:hypothetical protein DY000_02041382 [Brassica cretica]
MLAVQVTVFHIWKQRDNYLHNDISLPLSTIVKLIDREVRNAITGRKVRKRFDCLRFFLTPFSFKLRRKNSNNRL